MSATLDRREAARAELARALASRQHAFVLHYVGVKFEAADPRITAIAARNLGTGSTACFEIEQELRKQDIDLLAATPAQLDAAERRMLDAFSAFVRTRRNDFWLHWNMRNSLFGFAALENRHKVLGGRPATIPEQNQVDLADRLGDIYGASYAPATDRLRAIAVKNAIPVSYLLDGPEQGRALERREFAVGTRSLLNRIDILYAVATRIHEETLRTHASWRDRAGASGGWIKWAKDHPVAITFAILAPIGSVALVMLKFWTWFQNRP